MATNMPLHFGSLGAARHRTARLVSLGFLALGLCIAWPHAKAQVNRCIDSATGRIQYTDGACPSGQRSVEIEAAKTEEELELDRQRAEQAIAVRRERQLARERELELKAQIAAQENIAKSLENRPATALDYANSSACQHAQRMVDNATLSHGRYTRESRAQLESVQDRADQACLGPDAYAALQRQRALQTPPPVVVVPQPIYGHPGTSPPYPGYRPYPPPPALHFGIQFGSKPQVRPLPGPLNHPPVRPEPYPQTVPDQDPLLARP